MHVTTFEFPTLRFVLACGLMIALCIVTPICASHYYQLRFMELGYVEKVVVIGDANNPYTRHYETVWAPKDATDKDLVIEKKQ